MEFIDLHAQQQRIRETIEARIRTVLDHGQYIMGPEIKELESKLAAYVGVKHALGCASGTDALLMALMASQRRTRGRDLYQPLHLHRHGGSHQPAGSHPDFCGYR